MIHFLPFADVFFLWKKNTFLFDEWQQSFRSSQHRGAKNSIFFGWKKKWNNSIYVAICCSKSYLLVWLIGIGPMHWPKIDFHQLCLMKMTKNRISRATNSMDFGDFSCVYSSFFHQNSRKKNFTSIQKLLKNSFISKTSQNCHWTQIEI